MTSAALKSSIARSTTLLLAEFVIKSVVIVKLKITTKFASQKSTIVEIKMMMVRATSVPQVIR